MHYTCPYCQYHQIVQEKQLHYQNLQIWVENNIEGRIGFTLVATTCANPNCARTALKGELRKLVRNALGQLEPNGEPLDAWTLRPRGEARPLPDCIPKPIADDYTEACLIRDLSPKASATLIRRCLQGMIRDFCGISKPTLNKEIEALRKLMGEGTAPRGVSEESVDAIDRIRAIGNIGAHMEKDINIIIPVDADEAQLLIELTEMLFDEWYIARAKRGARLEALKEMADSKKELTTPQLPSPEPGDSV